MNWKDSPAQKQWARFKLRHPDCLLLFRIGDFYEAFEDDAKTLANVCGLTLTSRADVRMAGLPYHCLERYLRVLIAGGVRVAVCEQIAEAVKPSGATERAVTRVLDPGTIQDDRPDSPAPAQLGLFA